MPEENWEMKVSRSPWDPESHIFNGLDYILSMLLEIPQMYFVAPEGTYAYVYVWPRGIIRLHHDFHVMSQENVDLFIYLVRKDLEARGV